MSPRQYCGRGKTALTIRRQRPQTINHSSSLVVKAGRFHPRSINGSAGRFYPRITIGRLCAGGKKQEDLILALSMDALEGFILALLLDGHIQVVKSWKVSSSLFELEGFILALSTDVLEGFILVLLLKATDRKREDGKA